MEFRFSLFILQLSHRIVNPLCDIHTSHVPETSNRQQELQVEEGSTRLRTMSPTDLQCHLSKLAQPSEESRRPPVQSLFLHRRFLVSETLKMAAGCVQTSRAPNYRRTTA